MYGAIIGDIAGSAYEFDPVKRKDIELFPPGCFPTDDSVMTVAVAEALLSLPEGAPEEEIKKALSVSLKTWGRKYPDAGYGGRFFYWLLSEDMEPYNSFGNGSAMRVSPAGWLYDTLDETRYMARLTAAVTHDHPEGIKGAEAVAAAIFLARNGRCKGEIKAYLTEEFGYDLSGTLEEIRPVYDFDETCQGSVPESILCFLEGEDYEDTIRNAISLGGDADTMAAIGGSIAEAFYGIPRALMVQAIKRLPLEMREVTMIFYMETLGRVIADRRGR